LSGLRGRRLCWRRGARRFRCPRRKQIGDHFTVIDATDRSAEQGSYRGVESSVFAEVSQHRAADDDLVPRVVLAFCGLGLTFKCGNYPGLSDCIKRS
jgi:hypothetical protein